MKSLISITPGLALALGLFASPPASANPFTVTDVEIYKGESATILSPIGPETFAFGQIVLTTDMGAINAWCIDLFDNVFVGGGQSLPYITGVLTADGRKPTAAALSALQRQEIAGLVAHGNALLAGAGGTPDDSLATQLAIWSVEYPDFTYTAGTSATAEANYLISIASSLPGNAVALISLTGQQGFAAGANGSPGDVPVPEPVSFTLLGAGLAGLGLVRRKRA